MFDWAHGAQEQGLEGKLEHCGEGLQGLMLSQILLLGRKVWVMGKDLHRTSKAKAR